jgi:hypothetical protein
MPPGETILCITIAATVQDTTLLIDNELRTFAFAPYILLTTSHGKTEVINHQSPPALISTIPLPLPRMPPSLVPSSPGRRRLPRIAPPVLPVIVHALGRRRSRRRPPPTRARRRRARPRALRPRTRHVRRGRTIASGVPGRNRTTRGRVVAAPHVAVTRGRRVAVVARGRGWGT